MNSVRASLLSRCRPDLLRDGRAANFAVFIESVRTTSVESQHFEEFSKQGYRTLGVAYREIGTRSSIHKDDEVDMTFLGFLVLFDPPKPNIIDVIDQLKHLGVSLKVITGDNQLVAAHVSQQMGLSETRIITGPDLARLSDNALLRRVLDPIGPIFGFSPLPISFLLLVAMIVTGYIISAEVAKMIFYKKVS